MALSGRNPEANIDSQEPELFNINKLRRPHPIYARAIDNRWRTWPPIPLGPTVLEYRNVRSFARRPDEKTWHQIVRLTEMPFEIFTEDEVAGMSPDQREELMWPHLFWDTTDVHYMPGTALDFVVHVRGSEENIYRV